MSNYTDRYYIDDQRAKQPLANWLKWTREPVEGIKNPDAIALYKKLKNGG